MRYLYNWYPNKFHQTKLLLKLYRKLAWRLEEAIYDIDDTANELGSKRIGNLMDFLSFGLDDLDGAGDKQALAERLMSIAESKFMLEIIDNGLLRLRTHPENGELYYNIITCSYVNKEILPDNEIQGKLHMAPATFYRNKRKAINLFSVILWGFYLPSFK